MNNATFSQALATLRTHKGMTAPANDIRKLFNANTKFSFDEKCFSFGVAFGVSFDTVFSLPQKQVMRAIQLINALGTASYENLDYTHARILCAMKLAGSYDLNTDAIIALAGATRSDTVNTRGISYSALNTMFRKTHGSTTIQTKMSNSTGKNGFFQQLNMTFAAPGEINHTVSLNDEHPMIQRFFQLINSGTTGQLESMSGAQE